MTTEQYLATPETVLPTELAFGVLHVADSPTPTHQLLVLALGVALNNHVKATGAGKIWIAPLDVILDDAAHLVVQPDLFFISNERAAIVKDRVRGAPDLAIEVLSPWPRVGDVHTRINWFARYGVRECWLVYQPTQVIDVVQLNEDGIGDRARFAADEPIRSSVLPLFAESLSSMLAP
jgi:Uma2 family endonuclease